MSFPFTINRGSGFGSPVVRGPWQLIDGDPDLPISFGDPATPFTDPTAWLTTNGQLIDVRGISAVEIMAVSDPGQIFLTRIAAFQKAGPVYLPVGFTISMGLEFSSSTTNPAIGSKLADLNPNLASTMRPNSAWSFSASPDPIRVQVYQVAGNTPMFFRLFVYEFDFIAITERASSSRVSPFFIRPVAGLWDTPGSPWWRN